MKNYSILGLHWGLYRDKDLQAVRDCHLELTGLAERRSVKPLIGERLPLDNVAAGLQRLADGKTVGRVVFEP